MPRKSKFAPTPLISLNNKESAGISTLPQLTWAKIKKMKFKEIYAFIPSSLVFLDDEVALRVMSRGVQLKGEPFYYYNVCVYVGELESFLSIEGIYNLCYNEDTNIITTLNTSCPPKWTWNRNTARQNLSDFLDIFKKHDKFLIKVNDALAAENKEPPKTLGEYLIHVNNIVVDFSNNYVSIYRSIIEKVLAAGAENTDKPQKSTN